MTVQTDIHYEVTDTIAGEPNYSWVKRGVIAMKPGQDYTDLAAVRLVKKTIEWNNSRTTTEGDGGDGLIIRPRNPNIHMVCFVTFYSHGSAS